MKNFHALLLLLCLPSVLSAQQANARARARDLGLAPGRLAPGPRNAITDVAGVRVGHTTVIEGDSIRTGITAILPHSENPFFSRVPAAIVVGNGYGKLVGSTQVNELGELETPILLTCTLCVWRAADALVGYMLEQPGMEDVRSINPVIGETNDGTLNAIRSRPITANHVRSALATADTGEVAEGSVGAGTGTIAFGWKGGIGTSSRLLSERLGGWTVGVLVQSNFGGALTIGGVPFWKELRPGEARGRRADGSIIIVVATDAPLSDRNLRRLASRTLMGLGRTGAYASNGSGDYVIAFSTSPSVRRAAEPPSRRDASGAAGRPPADEVSNDEISPLFEAAAEATEEAVLNSLFQATTVESRGGRVEAIPLDRVRELLQP